MLRSVERIIGTAIKFVKVPTRKVIYNKKLSNLIDDIKRAKPIPEVDSLIADANKQLSNLTKEDLLRQVAYLTLAKGEEVEEIRNYQPSGAEGRTKSKAKAKSSRNGNPYHKKKARKKFERSKKKFKKKKK